MSGLNIGGATQGFDISGIHNYIATIRMFVVDKAIEQMRVGMLKVGDAVGATWQGKSADTFKKNFAYDVDVISNALNEACDVLEGTIYHAAQNLKRIDENIVKERGVGNGTN